MTVVCGLVLAAFTLWWALRLLPAGSDGHWPLPYLIALVPLLWIPVAVIALAAAAIGLWKIAAIAVVLAVVMVAARVPLHRYRYRRAPRHEVSRETHRETVDDPRCTTLTAMTLNCRFGRADAAAVVAAVRERQVTVLALQELTPELVKALDAAGLSKTLPYRSLGINRTTDNGGFNGIWTSYKPIASPSSAVNIPAADVPSITFQYRDNDSTVITSASAHPKSPMRGCRAWSQGIIGLSPLASTEKTLVLGDLNSGLDHPSFRRLLKAGFHDASLDVTGKPALTFPSWVPWPRLELDHALVTNDIDALDADAFMIPGSDHLALAVRLLV